MSIKTRALMRWVSCHPFPIRVRPPTPRPLYSRNASITGNHSIVNHSNRSTIACILHYGPNHMSWTMTMLKALGNLKAARKWCLRPVYVWRPFSTVGWTHASPADIQLQPRHRPLRVVVAAFIRTEVMFQYAIYMLTSRAKRLGSDTCRIIWLYTAAPLPVCCVYACRFVHVASCLDCSVGGLP